MLGFSEKKGPGLNFDRKEKSTPKLEAQLGQGNTFCAEDQERTLTFSERLKVKDAIHEGDERTAIAIAVRSDGQAKDP